MMRTYECLARGTRGQVETYINLSVRIKFHPPRAFLVVTTLLSREARRIVRSIIASVIKQRYEIHHVRSRSVRKVFRGKKKKNVPLSLPDMWNLSEAPSFPESAHLT